MHVRTCILTTLLAFGATAAVHANSCSNVDIHGSFDHSGLVVNEYQISAAGTFRIVGEPDESKQPLFNLTTIDCPKQMDGANTTIECKVAKAVVWSDSSKPNSDRPNCSLDIETSDYSMKELQRGVYIGLGTSGMCFSTMLTIDLGKNNAFLSFNRSKEADGIDKQTPGTCGAAPRTETLMNCTAYARMRQNNSTQSRVCDFGGVDSK